jgi:hypothetical protein
MNAIDAGKPDGVRSQSRDLLFDAAIGFSNDYSGLSDSLKSESLKPIAVAFARNMDRLRALAALPDAAAKVGVLTSLVFSDIAKKIQQPQPPMPVGEQFQERAVELGKETVNALGTPEYLEQLKIGTEAIHKVVSNTIKSQIHGVVVPEQFHEGLLAILSAQIIGAWTAFNALTTDLWITIVNRHPHLLDKLGKTKISLKILKEHRYHTSGRMGHLLSEKMRLDSFRGTRFAYQKIFKDDLHIPRILTGNAGLTEVCLVRT